LNFIARPLLAFKRDLSRASSSTRTSSDRDSIVTSEQPSIISYQESILPSTPLEIIDIETNDSFKMLLDKVKNTFSPTTKRHTSEDFFIDDTEKPSREQRHSSISALSNKTHRKNRLRHNKSVSFAENIESDNASPYPVFVQQDEHVHTLADDNIMTNIDGMTTHATSNFEDDDETDFEHHFHQAIQPRRRSIGSGKDLAYQDLSAEIVAYVLKHALRAIEKEDEELLLTENHKDEQEDELIDLK
jgi:hypothetical protein